MKLAIQICAEKEWPSIKSIFDVPDNRLQFSPFGECFDYPLGSNECKWFHSGATKTRAAAACQYAICTWDPDAIINLGTCGGVAHDVKELDIILANRTIQYDVIERFGELTESFQRDQETIIDVSWAKKCRSPEISHVGAIASADQDLSLEFRAELQTAKILAADWESASIAKICQLNKIKCLILRGVSDIPQDESSSEHLQDNHYCRNTPKIMERLVNIVRRMTSIFADTGRVPE
jgi:adenosylhomocysteine nucleosidase